jgi:catechol 2,3-dioxygenase-like lactoylglutathione lyase family enzyme
MIDHVSIGVSDLARARAFYDAVLAPLGYRRMFDVEDASGYGRSEPHPLKEQALPFWLSRNGEAPALNGHICFNAPYRGAVDAFHSAGLAAGGRDNGKPGLRPEYHPNYYAAFIIDLDGYRIEAVRHQPE